MTFPGKCSCYPGFLCYADCTCTHCDARRHDYAGGVILHGQRFFRAMDLRPDNPLLDTLVTLHFSDGPSRKEAVRDHPEMLVAIEDVMIRAKTNAEALTKKKVQATPDSGTVPDPKV